MLIYFIHFRLDGTDKATFIFTLMVTTLAQYVVMSPGDYSVNLRDINNNISKVNLT